MNELQRMSAAAEIAGELVAMLSAEGVTTFHPGLKSIVVMATEDLDDPVEALATMSRCLTTMSRGNGSLSDLVLNRDTFEERRDVNNYLHGLRTSLSVALSWDD